MDQPIHLHMAHTVQFNLNPPESRWTSHLLLTDIHCILGSINSGLNSLYSLNLGVVSLDNEAAGSPNLERVRPPLNLVGWYNGDAFLHLYTRCNHLGVSWEAVADVVILSFALDVL